MKRWASQMGFVIMGSIFLFLGVIFSFWPEAVDAGEVAPLFLVGVGLSLISLWAKKRVT